MNNRQLKQLAAALNLELWNSGGNIMLLNIPLPSGQIVCVSSDAIGVYANDELDPETGVVVYFDEE